MLPLAPGRFSTTTGWPSLPGRCADNWRAIRSIPVPGVNGTIRVMGRSGQAAWLAAAASDRVSAPRARMRVSMFVSPGVVVVSWPCEVSYEVSDTLRVSDTCSSFRVPASWPSVRRPLQERRACLQAGRVEAGDLLVAVRDAFQFRAADHVVDALVR